MEDHNDYYLKRKDDKENESRMLNALNAMNSREEDSLLVDLVKGYPHIYDKESKDFKNILKRNNSWTEIGEILNATASDCQARWARLRERYSREKKLREMESRSGSGNTMRSSFPLYEQMNFLFKFVKCRKSITNISNLNSKRLLSKMNESTEKFGCHMHHNLL